METYDLILDTVGKTSFTHCKNSLKQNGVYLPVVMDLTELLQILWTKVSGGKKVKGGVADGSVEDLEFFNSSKGYCEKSIRVGSSSVYVVSEPPVS